MSAALTAALLSALGGAEAKNYEIGKVPATKPAWYNEVVVIRRYGGTYRGDADPNAKLYRAFIRSVGQAVANATEMRRRALLLENTSLIVGDEKTTPLQFETEEPIGLDDGWYSGSLQLIFAL